jgi:CHAT domain-containing protein
VEQEFLKVAGVLACCLLSLPQSGEAWKARQTAGVKPASAAVHKSSGHKGLQDQLVVGAQLFRAARYEEARAVFEGTRLAAAAARDSYIQVRATANIGSCWFALHQYRLALKLFLDAQALAERNGDGSAVAALDANVASLYSEMGERDAAILWLEKSLTRWRNQERAEHVAQLKFELAALRARQNRFPEAKELFAKGIEAAARNGDWALVAVGYNKLGEELLRDGQWQEAEGPLLHAFYIRKLHRLPLEGSYTNLGKLRLAQGDLGSALALLDRGVEAVARSTGGMPVWDAYLARGEARLAQNNYREALADLRTAVHFARAWRWSLPADDASSVGAEGILDRVYSGVIEAGNRLYLETHDPALIRETFEASEENRAVSLRVLIQDRQETTEFPTAYWQALGQLQRAETVALRGGEQAAVDAARAEWIRQEARVAPDLVPLPAESLDKLRHALDSDTALFSVRLGMRDSWLWAAGQEGIELHRLPPRDEIQSLAAAASRAIRENQTNAQAPAELYQVLFRSLAPRFQHKSRWLLALDSALADVPFAALRVERGLHAPYLAERHVTEMIPGAAYWLQTGAQRSLSAQPGPFLGVGDPIYNRADPRLPSPSQVEGGPTTRWALFAAARPRETSWALPRLVGSGAEIERCGRMWGGEALLLRGREATGENVRKMLDRNPAVIHFAVHFLETAPPHPHGLIALGLGADQQPELITPVEVSHWRVQAGLVVLSGCGSGVGEALPGAGLMGLTRAWLTAGARAVLASRWATTDEDGALFAAFYREFRANGWDAAAALSRAQVRMIREGGWRARPSYWGTWFVVGN